MSKREGRAAPHHPAPEIDHSTDTEDSSGKVEVPPWLAALVETARRRKAQRKVDRAEFARRRAHGLRARKRAKLRRAGDHDDG